MKNKSNHRLMWFCGNIIPVENAMIPVLSPTAQFGLNVFEGVRCYWNENDKVLLAFRLDEHIDRLFESCKLIGLTAPYSRNEIKSAIYKTCSENNYNCDVALRITIFVGEEGTWHSSDPVDMFIAPIAKIRNTLTSQSKRSACISTWNRISDSALPPRVKLGANYMNGRYAQLEATRNGYDLPIFLGENRKVAEGAGACLFMLRNGSLVTPTGTNSILESITRDALIKISRFLDIPIEIREIDRTELYIADEVFLCGSAAELSPITSIDGYQIGNGVVGEITLKLSSFYFKVVNGEIDMFKEWVTPLDNNIGKMYEG
jgi:branched-chain amino acid aminotransferase